MNEFELRESREGLLDGDVSAAERFVTLAGPYLRGVWRRMGLGDEEIDDAYQEFFGRLWDEDLRRLRMWRGDGSLRGYLAVIARNLGLELVSRRVPRSPREAALADHGANPAGAVEARDGMAVVDRALAALAPRDRELLRLRHLEGLSYAEIGVHMRMTVSNVGVALHRAEAALGRLLPSEIAPPWKGRR